MISRIGIISTHETIIMDPINAVLMHTFYMFNTCINQCPLPYYLNKDKYHLRKIQSREWQRLSTFLVSKTAVINSIYVYTYTCVYIFILVFIISCNSYLLFFLCLASNFPFQAGTDYHQEAQLQQKLCQHILSPYQYSLELFSVLLQFSRIFRKD